MSATANLIANEEGYDEDITNDFSYKNNVASCHLYVRMGFLRKVYGLLSIQLLLTTVVAGVCAYSPVLMNTVQTNPWLLVMCLPLTMGLLIGLHINRHKVPLNFVLLAAFTVVQAMTVGVVVSLYEVASVVQALVITLVVVVALTSYTFQTKRDFTHMGLGLSIGLWCLIAATFLNIFMQSDGFSLLASIGGAALFSLFIVFDTQMMMEKLSPEEYILATVNLYLDIINLFLEILKIVGQRRN